MYNLLLFWKIGKKVYEDTSINTIEKYSNYYSYYYGNSYLFNRENKKSILNSYSKYFLFYVELLSLIFLGININYCLILMIEKKDCFIFIYHCSLIVILMRLVILLRIITM